MNKFKFFLTLFLFLFVPISVQAIGTDPTATNIEELKPIKLFDINELENVTKIKSMTITDKYFVILTDYTEEVTTYTVDPVEPTALFIYDKETYERVAGPIVFEHEFRDLTYSPLSNKIFLTGEEKYFFEMDPNTFEVQDSIKYDKELYGIAYRSNQFVITTSSTTELINNTFVLEKELNYVTDPSVISANQYGYFVSQTLPEDVEEYDLKQGDNIIYFESLVNQSPHIYFIKDIPGTLRIIEFDNETPYLLYQTGFNTGAVYVLQYDPITTEVEIPIISDTLDVKNMTFKATVKDDTGKEYEITSENGIFNLKDLTFNAPGNYKFYVTQIKDNQDIIYDSKDISFTIQVRHQAKLKGEATQIFTEGTLYIKDVIFEEEKKEFKNEKLDRSMLSCKEIDGKYYNKEGYEVTKEEYLTSCGLVENPQTGASLPILIMTIGLGIVGIIFYFSKNKIFRI